LASLELQSEEVEALQALSATDRADLRQRMNAARDPRERSDLALVLALNCEPADSLPDFGYLSLYRCSDGYDFGYLASGAVLSWSSLVAFAFAKDADKGRAVRFLRRYVEFWSREPDDGARPGEGDLEFPLELIGFLERSGVAER
jgi:hypothetical protein